MENTNPDEYTHLFKIVLVGDKETGKTHIIRKYISNTLPRNPVPTIGVEFAAKIVKLDNGVIVKAQVWDTAGQERYRAIITTHFRKTAGFIVVYDITKGQTFENVKRWIDDVRSIEPNAMILLIGNKLDVVEKDPNLREVPTEAAQTLASENDATFAEISVFTENGINGIIDAFLKRLTENVTPEKTSQPIVKEEAKISETTPVQEDKKVEESIDPSTLVHSMKIVLTGDESVGKTNVLYRYVKDTLPKNSLPTIGVEFSTKEIVLRNGVKVKNQIWDTAGQERYKAIITAHFRKASGVIVFYDLTKLKSFEKSMSCVEEARNVEPDVITMLVGNKLDLVEKNPSLRAVPRDAAQQMAKDNDMMYEEISAVTGQNVNQMFESLCEAILNKKHAGKTPLPEAKAI